MRLAETGDPVGLWQYAERYLGVGTRTYSRFSADLEISSRYHPQRGADSFALPAFVVPEPAGAYLPAMDSPLHERYRGDGWLLLPVHPDTLDHPGLAGRDALLACEPAAPLEVVPMANARTVLVRAVAGEPVEPHFLKLHYPRRLSRFGRRLRRPMIELQLWVSIQLYRAGVPYLPEVAGGVFGTDPAEGWGYVVRERHLLGGGPPYTVPLFALYGRDLHAPDDPTLLEQLVERSGLGAAELLCEHLVAPMVRLWWRILRATGCLAEPHGQNTLVTFAADGGAVGVGYRDCGVYVDPSRRRDGDLPPRNVISVDVDKPAPQVMSLVYDTFMGHHALSYVARLARDRLGVAPARLQEAARRAFREAADPAVALPETVYNYDDQLHPDGEWRLADTGSTPVWR